MTTERPTMLDKLETTDKNLDKLTELLRETGLFDTYEEGSTAEAIGDLLYKIQADVALVRGNVRTIQNRLMVI